MVTFSLIVLTLLTLGFVLWPIWAAGQRRVSRSVSDTPLGRLALRKEILLQNIAELDFERSMGKVAEEDYEALRESLKQQAAEVMEQIEVLEGHQSPALTPETAATNGQVASDTCPSCSKSLPAEARFCQFCGTNVLDRATRRPS